MAASAQQSLCQLLIASSRLHVLCHQSQSMIMTLILTLQEPRLCHETLHAGGDPATVRLADRTLAFAFQRCSDLLALLLRHGSTFALQTVLHVGTSLLLTT